MNVGDLRTLIEDLPDEMLVVTHEYNSGYGGHFEAGAEVGIVVVEDRGDSETKVLCIGPTFW